jgi:tetratricopeptide (TPR) repeat protein
MKEIADQKAAYSMGGAYLPAIVLLLLVAFCLATRIGPQQEARIVANGEGDENPLNTWLGSSSQMFANSFFIKADAYFHSGYYPTIFDNNAPFKTPHIGEDSETMESKNSGNEETIFSHPNNWVERFELNFFPSYHTHLDQGGVDGNGASEVKEIMPWLKLSTELDNKRIDTYLVTAYWLRVRMHKMNDAESILRDGLRANPGSAAIVFELGELYRENRDEPKQARNLYLAALNLWGAENDHKPVPDKFLLSHIAASLVKLERQQGNKEETLKYLQLLKLASPNPAAIQKQIDEIKSGRAPLFEPGTNTNRSLHTTKTINS